MKHSYVAFAALLVLFLTTLFCQAQAQTYCDEISGTFHSHLSDESNPKTNGTVELIVYLVAFEETGEDTKFKVSYPHTDDISYFFRNLFPEDLLDSYGPELPNGIHDPVKQLIDGFYNIMSKGQLRFSATYVQIDDVDESVFDLSTAQVCNFASTILEEYEDDDVYSYENYDAAMVVFPFVDELSDDYYVLTNSVMLLHGYHLLREPARFSEIPGILAGIGGMLGFPVSDFEELGGAIASDGDQTDLMGHGEFYKAFTNPVNHLRAGWLDEGSNIIELIRSGVYRVWPLYIDVYDKGYSFDPYQWSSYDASESREPYQQLVGLIMDPPEDGDGNPTDDPVMLWLRNDVTYKYDDNDDRRVVFDYSTQTLLHRYPDIDFYVAEDEDTTWLYPTNTSDSFSDEYLVEAALRVGDVFEETGAPCMVEMLCFDTTTTPSSILLDAYCAIASPYAVTRGIRFDGIDEVTTINSITASYFFQLDSRFITEYDDSTDMGGYIGFALKGSGCEGAAEYADELEHSTGLFWIGSFGHELYAAVESEVDLAICFAETSTGGIDDKFFTEQTEANSFINELITVAFQDGCEIGCSSGCNDCTEEFYCADSECQCGVDPNFFLADEGCCGDHGIANCTNYFFDGSITPSPCTCDCEIGFSGDYCDVINRSYFDLASYFPYQKYEEEEFTLHITLLAIPTGEDLQINCTGITSDDVTHELGYAIFAENSENSDLASNIAVFVEDGWSPGLNVTCIPVVSNASNYYDTPENSVYVEVTALRDVSYPENIVVTGYGELEASISWDAIDQADGFEDLLYYVLILEGVEENSDEDYDYVSNTLGYTISDGSNLTVYTFTGLTEGSVYTVRVSAQSLAHEGDALSPPSYLIAMNFSDTCDGSYSEPAPCDDCGTGTCYDGNCWCDGHDHGDSCELTGCFEYDGATSCSGRGNCTGDDSLMYCNCDETSYGHFCEKFSWSNVTIPFAQPESEGTESFSPLDTFIFKWDEIDSNSLSTSVDLYFKFGAGSYDEVYALDWEFYGAIEYDDGLGRYAITVPQVDEDVYDPDVAGYYFVQIIDNYYYGIFAESSIMIINESPVVGTAETGDEGTVEDDEGEDGLFDILFSDEYKVYTIAGTTAVTVLSLGSCWLCYMKMKRKREGYMGDEGDFEDHTGTELQ